VKERRGNVIENKGQLWKTWQRSGNVIENKGSYASKEGMLLKIQPLFLGPGDLRLDQPVRDDWRQLSVPRERQDGENPPCSLSFRGAAAGAEGREGGISQLPCFQSEIPPLRSARSKITRGLSFPRKRESSSMWTGLDPRPSASSGQAFRGGDNTGDFHLLGWAAGPWTLRVGMTMFADAFQHPLGTGRAITSRQTGRGCINSEFTIHNSLFRIAFARC
jgi:hypothetical protein